MIYLNNCLRLRVLLISCFLWFFLAPSHLFSQSQLSKEDVFQIGDGVRIRIWQIWEVGSTRGSNIELSGDYSIDGKGYIDLPIVGKVKVTGLRPEQVAELLKSKYSAYLREPVIIVRPLIRVTMQGAFNRPGSYRIDPESSLWELVALAGGPNQTCDLRKMRVERGGKVVIKNLLKSFEKGYSLRDIGIRSGDQILAPNRSRFTIRTLMGYLSFAMSAALLYLRIVERTR